MNALSVDTASGFLQSNTNLIDTFDAKKKLLFLDKYKNTANLSEVARELGFTPQCIYIHLQRDAAFKKALDDARNEISDRMESKLVEYGQQPNHFMDRIAWLRAYRADRYNPDMKMQVSVDHTYANVLADKAKAIDGEAI